MNETSSVSTVAAVSKHDSHQFSKSGVAQIELLAGLGVKGDAHCGATVKHRSRVAQDPLQANLRQVHLIHAELLTELKALGFKVSSGDLGENITTVGTDLLSLPVDTELKIGQDAVVRLTGLRNPCYQIDDFQTGLLKAVLGRDVQGGLIRKSGVMAVVVVGGVVRPDDQIVVVLPAGVPRALEPV